MPDRVLATARNVAMVLDQFRPRLEEAGLEVFFPADTSQVTLPEEALLRILPGCLAAVAMPDEYTARVIAAAAPTLKLIARSGVGYDSIDVEAAKRHSVWVTTTVGSNHDAVADYTFGLILALARRIVEINNETKAGVWKRFAGIELRGKTLGIVGTGRIGREVAARAVPFGLRVVAYDVYPNQEWAVQVGATYLPFEQLLAESDVITLHTPATPQTRHLIGEQTLARCKRGAYVVNTARGELIDEAALLAALDSGQFAGAGLDVYADEPPTEAQRPLITHPKVIATSHCAGAAVEAQRRAAEMALEEVLRVRQGDRPRFPVPELA
ncbi:MAG: phosphoglycerate dehydrogenase [Chloroflexi bacterium]|nr:phosphoglycerate dehydrogenase [Chloroflexota bacterium]